MHRINRLEIEIQASDVALGQALSERACRIHDRRVAPVLDRLCGELSGGEALDRLDALEVDLGTLPEEEFEDTFVERLEPALRNALAAALRRRGPRPGESARIALDLLETFALTGSLPWWADGQDPEVVTRHFAQAAAGAADELAALVRRIANDPAAMERLARASTGEAVVALATSAGGEGGPALVMAPRRMGVAQRRALLLALAGRRAVEQGGAGPQGRDGEGVAAGSPGTPPQGDAGGAAPAKPGREVGERHAGAARQPPAGELRSTTGGLTDPARGGPEPEPPEPERLGDRHLEVGLDPGRPFAHTGTPPEARLAIRAARRDALARLDEIYVDDAGLVILWPFLERFFTRAGLLGADRRFLGDEAALQAVALLEALATEDPESLEFRLALPKLLSGRRIESGYELDRPLTPEQLEEGEALLAAVIDRARVLGELSSSGFRATFLRRRGALTTRAGAWLLRVERQPQDVLLDRFPWSWGWVKLPWMPDPLQVEW